MAALVTLLVAKGHLLRNAAVDAGADPDLTVKITQASAMILAACGAQGDAAWTDVTVPAPVQQAVLRELAFLVGDRGDVPVNDPWPQILKDLMAAGYRDPTVA